MGNMMNQKKTSKKERKIFDSGKQRAEGSDVIYAKTKETKKVQILGEKPEVIVGFILYVIFLNFTVLMKMLQILSKRVQ